MGSRKQRFRFANILEDAEAERRRLIALSKSTRLDFPSTVRLINATAVGAATGFSTFRAEKLGHWIQLIEDGYVLALAKAASIVRGEHDPAYDRIPALDTFIRAHDDAQQLLDFAERLFALTLEDRHACTTPLYGAPEDSDLPEFSPARRGLCFADEPATQDVSDCNGQTHAYVVRMALKAIGPSAKVLVAQRAESTSSLCRLSWSLATKKWMPWIWTGADNPQEALRQLYTSACYQLVRTEYDWWLTKDQNLSAEDNPVLRWLAEPNEKNRQVAMSFALRQVAAKSDRGPPGNKSGATCADQLVSASASCREDGLSAENVDGDASEPRANGYVRCPSDPCAYVPVAVILAEYCDRTHVSTFNHVVKIIEDYSANGVRWTRPSSRKTGEPNPQRRSVHLVDWTKYASRFKRGLSPTNEDGIPEITEAELEARKAEVRRNRSKDN